MGDSVKVLPEGCIPCGRGLIYFPQLLSGDVIFTVGVRLLVVSDNLVSLVEDVSEHLEPLPGASLDDCNEFFQIDIGVFRGGVALLFWKVFQARVILGLQCA